MRNPDLAAHLPADRARRASARSTAARSARDVVDTVHNLPLAPGATLVPRPGRDDAGRPARLPRAARRARPTSATAATTSTAMAPSSSGGIDRRRVAEHPRATSTWRARPACRRCTTTSRRRGWRSPTATATSATRASSTCRDAQLLSDRVRPPARLPDQPGARADQPGRAGRPVRRRPAAARPQQPTDARPADDGDAHQPLRGHRPVGRRRLLHEHDRGARRQRHRRPGPRVPAQQRADRLRLRAAAGQRARPEPARRRQAAALEHVADDRAAARPAVHGARRRRAARRSSPRCCRS